MVLSLPANPTTKRLDKRALQKAVAEQNAHMGFVKDPTATAEKAQEMLLAQGVNPEDNTASCEIIQIRYEKMEQE